MSSIMWAGIELTLVVIGTDCTGSCKFKNQDNNKSLFSDIYIFEHISKWAAVPQPSSKLLKVALNTITQTLLIITQMYLLRG
jgi:hypothetical protein